MRVLALLALAACTTRLEAQRVERQPRKEDPLVALARRHAEDAAAKAVGCKVDEGYLSMRRAIAAGKILWRSTEPRGAEVLLGPLRSTTEAGGALGGLDVALEKGDCAAAAERLVQVRASLRFIGLSTTAPSSREAARALSESAYELGAVLVASSAETSATEEGVMADAAGLLDGIEEIAQALAGRKPDVTALRAVKRTDLARAAVLTGRLGHELRSMAPSPPPYAPRVATDLIHVLTVPGPKVPIDPELAALGAKLFTDTRLSANGRSCASCHVPSRAFTDTKSKVSRDAPSLLYAAPQAAFLWDGRLATASSQALFVIHSKDEMGITSEEIEKRVGIPADKVGRALAAYEETLVPANAPIDRFARGDEAALSPRSLAGFDVFVRARCSRCHVPPLFGGSRPTDFATPIYAVLGVPRAPDAKVLDDDRGRFHVTRDARDDRAFKTPHLRNVAKTAPYFHHGAFPTLDGVIAFYASGGGRALGLEVDPDVRKLDLGDAERQDLLELLRVGLADASTR
jgi:cytochrome c peroxidase